MEILTMKNKAPRFPPKMQFLFNINACLKTSSRCYLLPIDLPSIHKCSGNPDALNTFKIGLNK